MVTLKSGPSSESPEPRLLDGISGGGATILRNESKPSPSSNPVTGSEPAVAVESPQTKMNVFR
jgi:hypothetical protein